MTQQFDIIVIGDSKNGNSTIKQLALNNCKLKIAFISRNFKHSTTHDFLNVEYLKDEVIFTDYKNRLFGCYLKSGNRCYCTHIIFATGIKYAPLILKNKPLPESFVNLNEIPKAAKMQSAVVFGNTDAAVKLALKVAKKYKLVYLCSKTIELELKASATLQKKLEAATNIAVLPNTSLLKVTTFTDGTLKTIELDNYSTITCSAIFAVTDAIPETQEISIKLIQKNELGYLITTSSCESNLVPKCYAIGNCAVKSTKKMEAAMLESILADF